MNPVPQAAVNIGPPAASSNTISNTPGASNTVNLVQNTFNVTKTVTKKIVTNTLNMSTPLKTNYVPVGATKAKPQVAGDEVSMVLNKGRTTGTKRKSDELEPLGTQELVNKK